MGKKEERLRELKEKGQLLDIPSHEIEELLGIQLDDFDDRKRRHGYPSSGFYKDFSIEQAHKEKMMVDRLLSARLEGKLVFWRIAAPGKILVAMLVFLVMCLVSGGFWLHYVLKNDFYGSHYSFLVFLGSACIVWLLNRNKLTSKDPVNDYTRRRDEGYRDTKVLEQPQYS